MDTPPPVAEPVHPVALSPGTSGSSGPSGPHDLQVRDLRYRYPGRRRWALAGVDLDLSPGRRVAVVGPSGAGKSTLAGVLLRFLAYEGVGGDRSRSTAWSSLSWRVTQPGA